MQSEKQYIDLYTEAQHALWWVAAPLYRGLYIVITHYERLLEMIKPDVIHVLYKGRIVKTAGPELAKEIEQRGYDWIKEEVDAED